MVVHQCPTVGLEAAEVQRLYFGVELPVAQVALR
jgi:hypothetical protein